MIHLSGQIRYPDIILSLVLQALISRQLITENSKFRHASITGHLACGFWMSSNRVTVYRLDKRIKRGSALGPVL